MPNPQAIQAWKDRKVSMGFDPMSIDAFVSQKKAEKQKGIDLELEDVSTYADMIGEGMTFDQVPANLKPDVYKELQKRKGVSTEDVGTAPGMGIAEAVPAPMDQGPQYTPAREGLTAVGADGQMYTSTSQGTWTLKGLGDVSEAVGQEPVSMFETVKDREKRLNAEVEAQNYLSLPTPTREEYSKLSEDAKSILRTKGTAVPELEESKAAQESRNAIEGLVEVLMSVKEGAQEVDISQYGLSKMGLSSSLQRFNQKKLLAGQYLAKLVEKNRLSDADRTFYQEKIMKINPIGLQGIKEEAIDDLAKTIVTLTGFDSEEFDIGKKKEKVADRETTTSVAPDSTGDNFVEMAVDKLTDVSRFFFPETTKLFENALSTKQTLISPEKRLAGTLIPPTLLFGDEQINKAAREIGVAAVIDFATAAVLGRVGGLLNKVTQPVKGILSSFYKSSPAVQSFLSAFTIPTKLAGRLRPVETAKEMIEHGVKGSLESMDNVAMQVTGSSGIVTKLTRKALSAVKGEIDIDEVTKVANHSIKESLEIDDALGKKIIGKIRGQITPSKNIGKMNTLDSYNLAKKLERTGWRYLNSSTYLTKNTLNEDIGGVFLDASKTILENIDEVVKSEDILSKVLSQEAMSKLYGISPRLADQVTNAKTFSALRGVSAPFVRLSQMIRLTQEAAQSSFQNAARRTGVGLAGAGAGAYAGYKIAGIPGAITGAGLGMVGAPMAQAIGQGTEAPIMTSASQVMKWLAEQGLPSSPRLINEILNKGIRGSAQMIRAAMSGEGDFDINSAIDEAPQGGGMDINNAVGNTRRGVGVELNAFSPEGAKLYR